MNYIFLRLWLPQIYGWYLVFKNSTPICCISEEKFEIIRNYHNSKLSLSVESIKEIEYYLGAEINVAFKVYEVDPSKNNVIDDETAAEFIPAFYKYFGDVFKENSPFIDSDMDFLPILNQYFPSNPEYICIDLGAGSGNYSVSIANRVKKIYACDIETTRLKNRALPTNIIINECNIQNLPFNDNFFDFSMCNFVLEHVADPFKLVSEQIRTIKSGGTFLLSFPSFNYRDIYAAKQLGELPTLNFEHLRSFTGEIGVHPWEEETKKIVSHIYSVGGEIIEIRGINITNGLDAQSEVSLMPYLDLPEYKSSIIWPYNLFGQQTIIYGKKK